MNPGLWIPSHWAHKIAPLFLNVLVFFYQFLNKKKLKWRSFEFKGQKFSHPLGISGGVDKKGTNLKAWQILGSSFLEVGTVTPRAQNILQAPYLSRNIKQLALWNRMGFPSEGVDVVSQRLTQQSLQVPLWANVGKNRDTPLSEAHKDYILCMNQLSSFVDGFVINISSPNTKDLRELLEPQRLKNFLDKILLETNREGKIILLKISPDLSEEEFKNILDASLSLDGWILTNTTVLDELSKKKLGFSREGGGVSGKPLADKSKKFLKLCRKHLGERRKGKLLISSGGVFTARDILERLEEGADLVQVYSALVFKGSFFFQKVIKLLQEIDSKKEARELR